MNLSKDDRDQVIANEEESTSRKKMSLERSIHSSQSQFHVHCFIVSNRVHMHNLIRFRTNSAQDLAKCFAISRFLDGSIATSYIYMRRAYRDIPSNFRSSCGSSLSELTQLRVLAASR